MCRRLLPFVLIGSAFAGCSSFTTEPPIDNVGPDNDAGADSQTDISADATSDALRQDHLGMILIPTPSGHFFIDPREVTVAEFGVVSATPWKSLATAARAECATKITWSDRSNCMGVNGVPRPPTSNNEAAVNCIDWCDAAAYCEVRGKRLCGKIGGGAQATIDAGLERSLDEWTSACRGLADNDQPYGPGFIPDRCNVADLGGAPGPSRASCQGGVPGLFDMAGNVQEWVELCTDAANCAVRGGSFRSVAAETGCTHIHVPTRLHRYDEVGIRCCAD